MIAKEIEQDWLEKNLSKKTEVDELSKTIVFPIEQRYMYRYNQVTLRGKHCLAKKSCKGCHGTGKIGLLQDPRTKQKQTIFCKCLVEQETQNATQKEG